MDKALKPVAAAVEESITDAFKDAADAVDDAMDRVARDVDRAMKGVQDDSDAAARAIEQIEAKIGELRREAAQRVELDITADTSDVDGDIRRLERNLTTLRKARVDIDTQGAADALNGVTGALGGVAGAAGGAGRGLGSVASTAGSTGPVLAAVAAAAAVVTAALVAMAAAATAAVGALAAAGAGIAGSLGLAFAAVKVGSSGVTEALEAQSKAQQELAATGEISAATQDQLAAAMGNLSPSAQLVVRTLTELRSEWGAVRRTVQESLFQGQDANLRALSDALLPSVSTALDDVAKSLNEGADSFTRFITQGDGAAQIDAILANLSDTFDRLLPAFGNIGAGLLNLFGPASEQGKTLADTIVNLTERFQQWTADIVESGAFQDFLDQGMDALSSIGDVLGETGELLANLITPENIAAGIEIFDKLAASISQVNDFLSSTEGQQAMAAAMDTVQRAVDNVRVVVILAIGAITGLVSAFNFVRDTITNTGIVFNNVRAIIANFVTVATQRITAFVQQGIARFAGFRASVIAAFQAVVNGVQTRLANLRANISNWIAAVVGFFQRLPGRVQGALSSLVSTLRGIFNRALDAARTAVTSGINNIMDRIQALPGRIRSAAGAVYSAAKGMGSRIIDGIKDGVSGLAGDIGSAIRSGINNALGLPRTIGGTGIFSGASFTLPAFARGGIVDKATLGLLGEAGREVIVPMTNARRAAQLAVESGLVDMPAVQAAVLAAIKPEKLALAPGGPLGGVRGFGPLGLDRGTLDVLSRSSGPSGSPSPTATASGAQIGSGGPTKVINHNGERTYNFVMPPAPDADTLFEAFAARIADDAGL